MSAVTMGSREDHGGLGDGKTDGDNDLHLAPEFAAEVTEVLSDEHSRRIVASAIEKGKTIAEIASENAIPLSTCYRRVRQLVDERVMFVEKIVVTKEGKRHAIYRSAFSGMTTNFQNGSVSAEVTVNPDVVDRLHDMWLSMRWDTEQKR